MTQVRLYLLMVVVGMLCACGGAGDPKLVVGDDPNTPAEDVAVGDTAVPEEDVASEKDVVAEDDQVEPEDSIVPPLDIGQEVCAPDCDGKMCGDDGCGGACGTCMPGVPCTPDGLCGDCIPDCAGKECGDDGCGGLCGQCPPNLGCLEGICMHVDIPDCEGKVCGSDGLGGSCGDCPCADCSPDMTQCIDGQCYAEEVLDCDGIFDCGDACGDQPGCWEQCFDSALPEEQQAAEAVYDCIDEVDYYSCYDLPESQQNECWIEKQQLCQEPFVECWHGELSCQEMYLCSLNCADGDYDCQSDCMGEGDVDAQYLWDDLNVCLYESGYYDCPEWDDQCYADTWPECQHIFQECVHGDMTCGQVLECTQTCPGNDQSCSYDCYFNGTVEAQKLYSEVLTCIYTICPGGGPMCVQKAIQNACSEIYQECVAP